MTRPDSLIPVEAAAWPLFEACASGDLLTVEHHTLLHPDHIHTTINYYSPLHFAVRENHLEIVRHLLQLGANPINTGFEHYKLRALCIERHQIEVLQLLDTKLSEKCSVFEAGEVLAALTRNRDIPAIKATLDAQPQLLHTGDNSGNLPIHWAVMTRNVPLIDDLLARGANINAQRPDGAQPIHLTNGDYYYRGWRDLPPEAPHSHSFLIGYLIARSADYDISIATKLGDLERVAQLLNADPNLFNQVPAYAGYYNGTPIRNAASSGHHHLVKFLLDRGANPNQPEPIAPDGAALRDAIAGEHWEIVELLLTHGANPNAMVDSSGNCVWAARNAPPGIQKLLRDHGGKLGINMACYEHDAAAVEAELQADPNTPIHLHLPVEDRPLVELALRYQSDVLKKMSFPGAETLDYARWLLENGISPSLPDWLGVTPLHRFAKEGNIPMAALCLEFGAPLDPRDDHYKATPLDWALRYNQSEFDSWLRGLAAGLAV